METKLITVADASDYPRLDAAAAILREGGLVAFPTETVYGLGANALCDKAVRSIYQAKGRPSDNPLILHVADVTDFARLAAEVTPLAEKLLTAFCPGPLTLVVKRSLLVPDAVTGGLDTVGVRIPDNAVARELIKRAGVPIAAPSANTSGRPSPTTAQAVLADLDGRIGAVVDGGACVCGVESTIVDCSGTTATILRPGAVTREMLTEVLGKVDLDPALTDAAAVPKAPGMKYTHYAPLAPLYMLEGAAEKMAAAFQDRLLKAARCGQRIGVIASDEVIASLDDGVLAVSYGAQGCAEEIAVHLYACLRYFDDKPVDYILGEGIAETGMGLAVMNRLHKAAGFKIVAID